MELEIIILRKVSQTKTDKYHSFHLYVESRFFKKGHESRRKTIWEEKVDQWEKGWRTRGGNGGR
jgi:hypothetical protein